MIFNLNYRKKQTNNIINYVEKSLFKYTHDNIISGYIVVLIHGILMLISAILFLVGNKLQIYANTLFLFLVVIFHYYFNGCLITRIERKLWKDYPKWYGPKSSLGFIIVEKMGYEMNSELANNIFFGIMILITLFSIYRTYTM